MWWCSDGSTWPRRGSCTNECRSTRDLPLRRRRRTEWPVIKMRLRQLGLEGLGVQPMPHPRRPSQGDLVGADEMRHLSRGGVRRLEEEQARPGDADLGRARSAPSIRSGVPRLPRDRLAPAGLLPLRKRLRQPGIHTPVGRGRLRELPRTRRVRTPRPRRRRIRLASRNCKRRCGSPRPRPNGGCV